MISAGEDSKTVLAGKPLCVPVSGLPAKSEVARIIRLRHLVLLKVKPHLLILT